MLLSQFEQFLWHITVNRRTNMTLFDAKFLADIPLTYHTIVK